MARTLKTVTRSSVTPFRRPTVGGLRLPCFPRASFHPTLATVREDMSGLTVPSSASRNTSYTYEVTRLLALQHLQHERSSEEEDEPLPAAAWLRVRADKKGRGTF